MVCRGDWTDQEDMELLCKVLKHGKKWSEFAAEVKRTEHSVKNRFNSLILKQKKMSPEVKK